MRGALGLGVALVVLLLAARQPPELNTGADGPAQLLARQASQNGLRVDRVDVKLMRLGDWWRLSGARAAGGDPDELVWVVARWGPSFEPEFGPRRLGLRYQWEATVWPVGAGMPNESFLTVSPPPVWDELPDRSRPG